MVDYSMAPGIPGAEDQLSKWRCRQSSLFDRLTRDNAPGEMIPVRRLEREFTGWSCNGKKVPFSAVLTAGSAKKCRFYHVSGLLLI